MSDQPRWPAGTPVAPSGKGPGGGRFRGHIAPVGVDDAYALVAGLDPRRGEREDYTRRALHDAIDMGDLAHVQIAQSDGNQLAGAISYSPYEATEDYGSYTLIHHLGSIAGGGGVGTALVWEAVHAAYEAGHEGVYVEPIPESEPFYRRLGFTESDDTENYWVLSADRFEEWLEEHDPRRPDVESDWADVVAPSMAPGNRPAGTPVAPSGKGPGGGRFRDDDAGPDWAEKLFDAAPSGNRFTRGLMSHEQVARYVGRTDYRVFGRAGGGMGEVEFREYSDGRPIAVKTIHSQNPDEVDAEVDASLVARALGIPVPAVVRDPDRPDTVLMEYIQPIPSSDATIDRDVDASHLLGLLDVIIGNNDRHPANVVWTWDGPVGIDHGLAFTRVWHLPSSSTQNLRRVMDIVPTPATLTSSSRLGRALFRWEQTGVEDTQGLSGVLRMPVGEHIQWVFSKEAIREARRRIEPLQSQAQPHHFSGMMQVLDVLEQMSVGGQMLD